MGRLIVFALLAVVVLVLVAGFWTTASASAGSGMEPAAQAPGAATTAEAARIRFSPGEQGALWVASLLAAVTVVVLTHSERWLFLPIPAIAWVCTAGLVARSAHKREPATARQQERTRQQPGPRPVAAAGRAQRVREFGESGVQLLGRAQTAADRIARTEAARSGWLGDPAEIDFTPELAAIAANARTAEELRRLASMLAAPANPSADDRATCTNAQRRAETLREQCLQRTQALEQCAEQAARVDESLQQERIQKRDDELRDAVRSRIHALLFLADNAPTKPVPEAVEKIAAQVAAYREIKGELAPARDASRPSPFGGAGPAGPRAG